MRHGASLVGSKPWFQPLILFPISKVSRRRDRTLSWLDHERGVSPVSSDANWGTRVSVGLVVYALAAP